MKYNAALTKSAQSVTGCGHFYVCFKAKCNTSIKKLSKEPIKNGLLWPADLLQKPFNITAKYIHLFVCICNFTVKHIIGLYVHSHFKE